MKFIPVAEPSLNNLEKTYVLDCLQSGWVSSQGKYIQKFENSFAEFFQVKYATSCSNGTVALQLALKALNIGPGDEVILPVLTFIASANAIKYVGATPVFVDINPDTWNIDDHQIAVKITKQTKAIMPVHLYGNPCNMDKIIAIASKYKLKIIEDAAEAHGAKFKNKYAGTFGNAGCFSFYGNKIITTGEGGMVVTNNKKLYEKMLILKNHGMSETRKYFHPIIGYNFRMTNIQAALGLAQLQKIKQFLLERKRITQTYNKYLQYIPEVKFQTVAKNAKSVCWLYSILITKKRDQLMKFLKSNHIDSRPFFYPLTKMPMYQTREKFPVAEAISRQGINLPTYVNLTTVQIKYICHSIKQFFQKK